MRNIQLNGLVDKLNSTIENKFGVTVRYIPITDRTPKFAATLATAKRNPGAPMIVAHDLMIVPVKFEGTLVGATCVERIDLLEPKELGEVKRKIDATIMTAVQEFGSDLEESVVDREIADVIDLSKRRTASTKQSLADQTTQAQ